MHEEVTRERAVRTGATNHRRQPTLPSAAAMLGGAALLVGDIGTSLLRTGVKKSAAASSAGWVALTCLFLVAFFGAALALVALRQPRRLPAADALPSLPFAWALGGTMMFFSVCWSGAFILPAAAASAPAFVDSADHPGGMAAGYAFSMFLFASGWLAVAVTALRRGIFSRALALAVGGGALVVFIGGALELPGAFALYAVALIALGRHLQSQPSRAGS